MSVSEFPWRGYLPALPTPFADDGRLLTDGVETLSGFMVAAGAEAVVVGGTIGEWTSWRGREFDQVVTAARRGAGDAGVVAGCTGYTAREVVARTRVAARAGAQAALIAPPPYVVPGRAELVRFFRDVADGTALPIVIYNWPRGTGVDLTPALLQELADLEAVAAIKQSTPSAQRVKVTVARLAAHVPVFGVPLDQTGVQLVRSGAAGTIGAGGILCRDQVRFFKLARQGRAAAAVRAGHGDRHLMRHWFARDLGGRIGSAPAVVKAALNLLGLPAGRVRPPLLDIDPRGMAVIRQGLVVAGALR